LFYALNSDGPQQKKIERKYLQNENKVSAWIQCVLYHFFLTKLYVFYLSLIAECAGWYLDMRVAYVKLTNRNVVTRISRVMKQRIRSMLSFHQQQPNSTCMHSWMCTVHPIYYTLCAATIITHIFSLPDNQVALVRSIVEIHSTVAKDQPIEQRQLMCRLLNDVPVSNSNKSDHQVVYKTNRI
jgi:hypothetical protein